MRPVVFLDTETTSLGPDREVWEAALIRRTDAGDQEINFFLPIKEEKADLISLNIGGYYQRHPWHAEPPRDKAMPTNSYVESDKLSRPWIAAEFIHRWTADAFIVGAVPNFDTEVLERLLRKQGFLPRWHYHLRDVEAMAVGYLLAKSPSYANDRLRDGWGSDALSRECGVEPPSDEERHTALGDARWAMRWYDALMNGGE